MQERALVLAGGGVAGIAWLLGVVEALRAGGVDLATADQIIGTSAGSVVGAQLATGQLAAAVAMQERTETSEIYVEVDLQSFFDTAAKLAVGAADEQEVMRRYGAAAIEHETVSEAARKVAGAARLPSHEWPEHPLRIASVDAATGELVVFDRSSGVPLVDAVAASCAVPLVWPPATIRNKRYIDGGTRSFTNADLARGFGRVLILIPTAPNPVLTQKLDRELAQLADARTLVVRVDEASAAAIGPNPLDPARRKPALEAGRRQGREVLDDVRAFWT